MRTSKSLSAALGSRGSVKKRVTGGKTAYTGLRLKLNGSLVEAD